MDSRIYKGLLLDDFCLLLYIEKLIMNEEIKFDYQSLIVGVVDDVVNKEKLLGVFVDRCLPRLCPYDYERKYGRFLAPFASVTAFYITHI